MLGTIAHAIWIASNPDFSHEQSWDGSNYSIQDSMGSRGTISFAGDLAVGVFFDKESTRNPFRTAQPYHMDSLLTGMSPEHLSLANNEALQYVLQEYDGTVMPIITAAFWNAGEHLTAAEPWSQVFIHGAHLIRIQLHDPVAAIKEWQTEYQMSSSQVNLMKSLFERRIAYPNQQIFLNDWEQDILTSSGMEGLTESQELLAAVGVVLPY
jgi:hypothetical protein